MSQPKVWWCKGLPSSGKTTLAKQILASDEDAVRLNKDDIREMLDNKNRNLEKIFTFDAMKNMLFMGQKSGSRFDKLAKGAREKVIQSFDGKNASEKLFNAQKAKTFGPREKFVLKIEAAIMYYLVEKRKNIVVDNTNYNPQHFARTKDICKGYAFEIKDMHADYGITIEECVKRNNERSKRGERSVPNVAIYSMAKQYGITGVKQVVDVKPFVSDSKYVVCDVDGTLADISHRLKYIDGTLGDKKDWTGFFNAMENDIVRDVTKCLVNEVYKAFPIVIVTGRPDAYKEMTEKWLKDNGVRYDAIYTRKSGDHRPDTIVKQEILDLYLDKSKVEIVLDDRACVISMWKSNGLSTINMGGENNDF